MTLAPVYMDVTELVLHPLGTGIQRIEREIIRHWPGPAPLVPLFFDARAARFCRLPAELAGALPDDAAAAEAPRWDHLMRHCRSWEKTEVDAPGCRVLNSELFFNAARANAYLELVTRGKSEVFWIVMDFLPYLQPEDFSAGIVKHCMHYIRALRKIPRVGFISLKTRRDYTHRIARASNAAGPVFALGADGVGVERQDFRPDKTMFLMVGTIEPRKRVANVLEAFKLLWERGVEAHLAVVGCLLDTATSEPQLLKELSSQPRLSYHGHVSDQELRTLYRQARATLFVSRGEGFGLPVFESLNAGIPVICASEGIPSLELIAGHGQIRLHDVSPAEIASAVEGLMDDAKAERLWRDVGELSLPCWKDFTGEVADWVQGSDEAQANEEQEHQRSEPFGAVR